MLRVAKGITSSANTITIKGTVLSKYLFHVMMGERSHHTGSPTVHFLASLARCMLKLSHPRHLTCTITLDTNASIGSCSHVPDIASNTYVQCLAHANTSDGLGPVYCTPLLISLIPTYCGVVHSSIQLQTVCSRTTLEKRCLLIFKSPSLPFS